MVKVKDILEIKGKAIVTIREDQSLYQALETFAAKKVGSLIVLDASDKIVGIVSPRDVLTDIIKHCDQIHKTTVSEVMTKELIVGTPEDDLDYVQAIMTENRIRHLPIVEQNNLVGIVSIGDVVKAQLKEIAVENHYLRDYMISKYPA